MDSSPKSFLHRHAPVAFRDVAEVYRNSLDFGVSPCTFRPVAIDNRSKHVVNTIPAFADTKESVAVCPASFCASGFKLPRTFVWMKQFAHHRRSPQRAL